MGDFRNKADEAKGRAKEGLGKATGDREMEGEGTGEKLRAKAEGAVDGAREKAGEAAEKIRGMMGDRK